MDDTDEDLRTRRGKFLEVEQISGRYREIDANGEIAEYVAVEHPLELWIENIALHTTSDVISGGVRDLLTGTSYEKFRAIGTEGHYQILDVSIGSETPEGTAVIRDVYGQDGHGLSSQMSIGLPDEAVKVFGERLPGMIRIGGIEKGTFFTSSAHNRAMLLDHWRGHIISESGSDNIIAEWRFAFSTATLSPEGYSGSFGAYFPPSRNDRNVSGSITINHSNGHPLRQTVENLAQSLLQANRNISYSLIAIAALLLYLAFKRA